MQQQRFAAFEIDFEIPAYGKPLARNERALWLSRPIQHLVQVQQRLRAKPACKTLSRQTQTITDALHAHRVQRCNDLIWPAQRLDWDGSQHTWQLRALQTNVRLTCAAQHERSAGCRCNREVTLNAS